MITSLEILGGIYLLINFHILTFQFNLGKMYIYVYAYMSELADKSLDPNLNLPSFRDVPVSECVVLPQQRRVPT